MDFRKLGAAMGDSNEGFLAMDLQGRILTVNGAICQMSGYSIEEVIGRQVQDFLDEATRTYTDFMLSQVAVTERRRHDEITMISREGRKVSLVINSTTFRDEAGNPGGSYMFVTDVTNLRRSEKSLGESLKTVRALLDASTDLMFLLDRQGTVIDMNDRLASALKRPREEVIGTVYFDNFAPEVAKTRRTRAEKVFATGKTKIFFDENQGRSFAHSIAPVKGEDGNVERIAVFVKDITEEVENRQRLAQQEERLYQIKRLEGIGSLAGGIAHDFNNLLTGILGNASLLRGSFEAGSQERRRIDRIIRLGESGARLTSHLLGFARGGRYENRPIEVRDLIERSLELFDRTSRGFSVIKEFPATIGTISADSGEMEQVLLNVFVNALQAAGQSGRMSVFASKVELKGPEAVTKGLHDGHYARICITDNGPGIPEGIIDRIFEPFFSTKEKDIGTGLGLASAYGIIKNHGGSIEPSNNPSGGAVFTIHLPLCSAEKMEQAKILKTSQADSARVMKILVIEDEPEVSGVMADMLQSLGHEVIIASDAETARRILRNEGNSIDAAILDLILRGDSGVNLYREFRASRPEMPIVITTGDPEISENPSEFIEICDRTVFMKKPFNIKVLFSSIEKAVFARKVLDEPANGM